MYTFGFAKLIAIAFIPNSQGYTKISFEDRNHHNCKVGNIDWVSCTNWEIYCRAKTKKKKLEMANLKPAQFHAFCVCSYPLEANNNNTFSQNVDLKKSNLRFANLF